MVGELESLGADVRTQTDTLERAHAQVETHAAELHELRAQVVLAEQRLRTALAPNFNPHDREAAEQEQQVRLYYCTLSPLYCSQYRGSVYTIGQILL